MTDGQLGVYCRCTPVYETSYDPDADQTPTAAVVEALGAVEESAPADRTPLYEHVDLEALERLFEHRDGPDQSTVVSFTVDEWNVFLRDGGRLRVCEPDPTAESAPAFERAVCD